MYFLALAADYDGTLAHDGVMSAETREALRRFRVTGRRVILVTGREIPDLKAVLPDLTIFDHIVAENGALLYDPATGQERLLAAPPPPAFIDRLREMGVTPLSVGRCVVATWEPQEAKVLTAIREHGLELRIAFNKGAVMVLPQGISKASGLTAALAELGLSPKNVVGVGDAENDHAFLAMCGCAAAVSDALPPLKASVDIPLTRDHGDGVVELTERIMAEDARLAPLSRHGITIGTDGTGRPVMLGPSAGLVLVVGPSGAGKSTLTTTMTEQMVARGLSFCVMDPEGDYYELQHAVCVGSAATAPSIHDALQLQQDAQVNLVINSQALKLSERLRLFGQLVHESAASRQKTGRPHWLVLDESHEMVPAGRTTGHAEIPHGAPNMILVTMYPEALDAKILSKVDAVLAFGSDPARFLLPFSQISGQALPADLPHPQQGELLLWQPKSQDPPILLRAMPPHQHHHRHIGKYATGDVGPWHSFYFRGPNGRINRPARNLYDFIDLADAVDDTVWLYHLRAGDYTHWFHDVIRDTALSDETRKIAEDASLSARDSRRLIKRAIWRRYAAPCERVAAAAE